MLSSRGYFPATSVLAAAQRAYPTDPHGAPREKRVYDAHDAFACALVHPGLAPNVRAKLVEATIGAEAAGRGWRSRRKSFAIFRWAAEHGHVDRSLLSAPLAERVDIRPPRGPKKPALDPHPQGGRGALACFAAVWPRFRQRLESEREHESWLDYPGIADMGRRHARAFTSGCKAPWVQDVFEAMEHVLVHGDGEAKNLVVVGLMEAVQAWAYPAGRAGDRYEAMLPPNAAKAWADLIEGWTGEGIRTLDAWRKKGTTGA
ncbi:hypothetical protein [Polyangium sp. 15x6]|uniref:DUF7674 family protein n=1 Tax=Polyangium sp. 15x6 TaxID=3042687 RepID=UPI00249C2E43|nr:hypothetical protein [Polyangium sp. 15x6]MDI3285187.1 hypothetical protein [Polyangium sp. 15x6]